MTTASEKPERVEFKGKSKKRNDCRSATASNFNKDEF